MVRLGQRARPGHDLVGIPFATTLMRRRDSSLRDEPGHSNCAAGASTPWYVRRCARGLAIGGSGTGTTHVCTALGVAACQQGKRVRAFTATELVSELEEAQEQHQLHRYLRRFASHDLVVVDELGYLPISEHAADLLFQALSERHERGSVIVNSNLPFAEWGNVFQTERLAVALLDRTTHKAHILEMNDESYRLKSATRRAPTRGKEEVTQ